MFLQLRTKINCKVYFQLVFLIYIYTYILYIYVYIFFLNEYDYMLRPMSLYSESPQNQGVSLGTPNTVQMSSPGLSFNLIS